MKNCTLQLFVAPGVVKSFSSSINFKVSVKLDDLRAQILVHWVRDALDSSVVGKIRCSVLFHFFTVQGKKLK